MDGGEEGVHTMKRLLAALAVLALLAALSSGCGGDGNGTTEPERDEVTEDEVIVEEPEDGGEIFTLAELAEFDGMDGRPAYAAVDGVVYDITGSPLWPEGDHTPCGLDAMAGRDLSEEIGQSPHGRAIFTENDIPVVGTLE